MSIVNRSHCVTIRLPHLAAATLFFLTLTTTTQIDETKSFFQTSLMAVPQPQSLTSQPPMAVMIKDQSFQDVLTPRDAELYKTAFEAQEKGDLQAADLALADIKDQKLMGHVLADRYLRMGMTLAQAQKWMMAYNDAPESLEIYAKAKKLHGFEAAHLVRPLSLTTWSKGTGAESSAGFHVPDENDNTFPKVHVENKIMVALKRGDPGMAKDILAAEVQKKTLSATDAGEIMGKVAASYFYEGQSDRARPLAHTAAAYGNPLGLWIDGLASWQQHDFLFASRSFAALAQAPGLSPWDRSAASFWAYRASKKSGDEPQARHWLAEAAKAPHSFYGAMAISLTTDRHTRSWKLPELDSHKVTILSQQKAGWQALALIEVGKNQLAEAELRHLNLTNRDIQNAALALAEKSRMPSLTVQLGGVATNDNGQVYEAALYPLPPWQPKNGFKVDRALIYALIKHESEFEPTAVSTAGACGLMQIMPSTAHLMGHDKDGRRCSTGLMDPSTNIEMGQKYVRLLADQPMIGTNLLYLLAAYNGGPGNLVHWLDGDRKDPLLFIESLPMRETRDYIQQVVVQYWMYRSRLSEPETTAVQLAHGEWPHYALNDQNIAATDESALEVASVDQSVAVGVR